MVSVAPGRKPVTRPRPCRRNFTGRLDDPNTPLMADVIDPFVYRERLTMPKLVVDATGDEFFEPDDNW